MSFSSPLCRQVRHSAVSHSHPHALASSKVCGTMLVFAMLVPTTEPATNVAAGYGRLDSGNLDLQHLNLAFHRVERDQQGPHGGSCVAIACGHGLIDGGLQLD